ncbi:B3 domain-containing protein, partial [Cephalotus follicularis]
TGRVWLADVIKIDNKLFFKNGWKEFVEDHHLEFGDFLVFCYEKRSNFFVNIYGRNACEKDTSKVAIDGVRLFSCKGSQLPEKSSIEDREEGEKGLKESNGKGVN